jgi:hypothetical protein
MAEAMAGEQTIHSGGCLCDAVRYEVRRKLRNVVNCHCTMCQRLHGVFGAHSKAKKSDIVIVRDDGLEWYASSEHAHRGFCRRCGASLFWRPVDQDATGILAGSLDAPSGLKTLGHIFTAEKAGFYGIDDGLPAFNASSDGGFEEDPCNAAAQ